MSAQSPTRSDTDGSCWSATDSYGGAVVAAYAGRQPDRVGGLVFADCAGDLHRTPAESLEPMRRGLREDYAGFTRKWFEGILAGALPGTRASVLDALARTRPEVFVGATEALYRFDMNAALARYDGPRLSIASMLFDNPVAIHKTPPPRPRPAGGIRQSLADVGPARRLPKGARHLSRRYFALKTEHSGLGARLCQREEPGPKVSVPGGGPMHSLKTIALATAIGAAACVARADSRVEKALTLAPGGSFTIRTDLGGVRVVGTDRPGARLVVTSTRDDLNDLLSFQYDEGAGSASVIARKRHPISFFGNHGNSVRFEIEVPAQTRVQVDTSGGAIKVTSLRGDTKLGTSGGGIEVREHTGEVSANTSGGGITLSHVHGRCRVETSGGGITADAIDGAVDGETSGGSIRFDGITGDIKAHSSGGGIHIREAGGRVEADTSGGSVQVAFTRANARGGSIESSGGGVTVSVDPSVGLAIDASGNSVRADIPITVRGEISRRHLKGLLGSGGETLRLRTSGGSVHILPL